MTLTEIFATRYPEFSLPLPSLRIKREGNIFSVFDSFRKKFVKLTPEEFVRQCFVHYLINYLDFPSSLISNEVGIKLNGTQKRCDTIVFSRNGEALVVVEYKAPDIKITQEVFDQIARYSMSTGTRCLIVSNGVSNFCCLLYPEQNTYEFLDHLPDFDELNTLINS